MEMRIPSRTSSRIGHSSVNAVAEHAEPFIHCASRPTRSLQRQMVNIGRLLGASAS